MLENLIRWELPPRARRIQVPRIGLSSTFGTTSACAENTTAKQNFITPVGNYLRVRGEYSWMIALISTTGELPPRARRILFEHICPTQATGTTSACAENTAGNVGTWLSEGNYLRVRGEY